MYKSRLVLFFGPSGVGKSALISNLCLEFPNKYEYVKPYCTRDLRVGETDKVHISKRRFLELVKEKKIINSTKLYGNLYGPSMDRIKIILNNKKFPLLDWPIKLVNKFDFVKPLKIYVLPPNLSILKNRLNKRDSSGMRYKQAVKEVGKIERGIYVSKINILFTNKGKIKSNAIKLNKLIDLSIRRKYASRNKG